MDDWVSYIQSICTCGMHGRGVPVSIDEYRTCQQCPAHNLAQWPPERIEEILKDRERI